jgi:N-acetylglucosaminyldiphosphoundecaprenol N-acetyl-beta-D-mannosaminyltransferase
MTDLVPATVLGLPIAAATMDAAVVRVLATAVGYVCCANVHMVTLARRDETLRAAMAGADLVTSDGMPLVWLLRRRHPWAERVAGPDLMAALCAEVAMRRLPVYLLGGGEVVNAALDAALRARWPDLVIAGRASPSVPDRPGPDPDRVAAIRASGARLVFVGLGCPKQELWLAANAAATGAVCLGVGQAFDVLAGTAPRAPAWMRRAGLEWLFRLAREPRRLGRRYLVTNALFVADVGAHMLRSGRLPV